jgi:hypothetical protein
MVFIDSRSFLNLFNAMFHRSYRLPIPLAKILSLQALFSALYFHAGLEQIIDHHSLLILIISCFFRLGIWKHTSSIIGTRKGTNQSSTLCSLMQEKLWSLTHMTTQLYQGHSIMICLALALLLGSLCDSLLGTFSKTVSVGYIVFFVVEQITREKHVV